MHESVLLHEAVAALAIDKDGLYIDGTFGRGGHSRYLLSQLSSQGRLIVFDKDPQAIEAANQLKEADARVSVVHDSFSHLSEEMAKRGLLGQVSGVLLDLGVSSPQLDEAGRGFSFLKDGPLDMRMNTQRGLSAADWINEADQDEIRLVLSKYGEEKFAGLIAKKIVERRAQQSFERTLELSMFIEGVIPKKFHKHKHPATRSFQGIRIHINNELADLEALLEHVVPVLKVGGRLSVISFHSLEDRMVKQFIKKQEKGPEVPRNIPLMSIPREAHMVSVGKAVKPSDQEQADNIRARSAILRAAEKVAAHG